MLQLTSPNFLPPVFFLQHVVLNNLLQWQIFFCAISEYFVPQAPLHCEANLWPPDADIGER